MAIAGAAACNSTPEATLTLSVGDEADALSRAPAPTKLVVDSIDVDSGATTNLSSVDLPATDIDLGDQNTSVAVRIRVNGVDGTGRVLVTGTSVPVQLGALEGTSLPLFVQRTSEFARMPSPLSDAREAPLLVNVSDRYVVVAGGSTPAGNTASQIYDLASLSPFGSPPALPRAPRSLAVYGSTLLVVDDAGASSVDLSDATAQTPTIDPPSGGSFAEVAGGLTVAAPDKSLYIVGATRPSNPTSRILKVTTEGTLLFVSLTTSRRGAAATWVEGRGLVVIGGNETGAGVEVLAPGATATTSLPYPPDATVGAGAATLDGAHVLVGGGLDAAGQPAPTRVVDLGCAAATCAAATWDLANPPVTLVAAQAFELAADAALLVGDDAAGLSHAFRVTQQGATEVPFKVARRGARGIRVNPPAITFVGGAGVVESFTP